MIFHTQTIKHDPTMFEEKGLVGPSDDGFYWVEVLVPWGGKL